MSVVGGWLRQIYSWERFTSHSSVQTGLFSRVWLQISKLTHSSGRSGGRGGTCSLSPSRVLLSGCSRGFDWLQQSFPPPHPERRGEPNEGSWSRRDNLTHFSEAIVVPRVATADCYDRLPCKMSERWHPLIASLSDHVMEDKGRQQKSHVWEAGTRNCCVHASMSVF